MIEFYEVLERSRNGPKMAEKEFNLALFKRTSELTKKYGIKYAPEDPVPTEEMADSLYDAAIELVCGMGMYDVDTNRCIRFGEDEVRNYVNSLQHEIMI